MRVGPGPGPGSAQHHMQLVKLTVLLLTKVGGLPRAGLGRVTLGGRESMQHAVLCSGYNRCPSQSGSDFAEAQLKHVVIVRHG